MSFKQLALDNASVTRACALIGPPSGAHKQSSAAFTFPFFLFSFSFFFACFHPSSSPCLKQQHNILDASGTRFHHQISLLLEHPRSRVASAASHTCRPVSTSIRPNTSTLRMS